MLDRLKTLAAPLDGWKLYLLGVTVILIGGVELLKIDILEPVTQANALEYILAGWAIIGGKSAIKKLETKP